MENKGSVKSSRQDLKLDINTLTNGNPNLVPNDFKTDLPYETLINN